MNEWSCTPFSPICCHGVDTQNSTLFYLYHRNKCRSQYVVTLLIVIGIYQVRILAGIPIIILTEGFHSFPQSLQANVETVP